MKTYYKTRENNPKLTTLGFTLIELIAVLVIMAILALIVTPLVMNIIKKARVSADKRSIDAYGRSVEIAIAEYLLNNSNFPTSIQELTVEYRGEQVLCSTTELNEDSVYLAGCTVGGRNVDGYTYGKEEAAPTYKAYKVGDEVKYNNVDYYVIKDSDETESSVTLLKAEPLSVDEVNQYGAGHINRYTSSSQGTAADKNGYGGMAYYTSETCGFVNFDWVESGCTADYESSDIKYVIDTWKEAKALGASESRLLTISDTLSLGYEELCIENGFCPRHATPSWFYNVNYSYWTMSQHKDSSMYVWTVGNDGSLNGGSGNGNIVAVRPVIILSKSFISS